MNKLLYLVQWIPLLPLAGFIINGLGRKYLGKTLIGLIGSGTVLAAFALSVYVFTQVKAGHPLDVAYFDFIKVGSLSIPFEFRIDALSSLFLLIITGVGFLIHVYSTAYMQEEKAEHFGRFFAYLNLFVFSMLLLVMGGNFVILFIGWEGVGLCSYLLIGYWFKNQEYNKAANKAFIMNRIGDLAFLVAIFWIVSKTGTASFDTLFTSASLEKLGPTDVLVVTLLLFIGATGKSAQIPLFTWLPDAMAGPTPVSALIHAATMVTAGIYMIARSNALYSLAPLTTEIITWVGMATALLAATIALKQNDIKKVLAYSTVSQLGFMFVALGTGAYTAAVFHVMTHAFFKALLFLGSGSVIHGMSGEQDIRHMGGLGSKMRWTAITFLIGCIAIAGIPPLSGFFSKDAILLSAFQKSPVLYGIAVFTAMLTAFYMFRLYFITFTGKFRGTEEQAHHVHESPMAMVLPLIILAVLSIVGGLIGIPEVFMKEGDQLGAFLAPVIPVHEGHHIEASKEYFLMGLSTVGAIAMIIAAMYMYRNYQPSETRGFAKLLENKWYVDEIYDTLIVRPVKWMGGFLNSVFETKVVDGIVNGVGRLVQYGGRQLRLLQTGQVGVYVLLMVVSMVILFAIQYFLKK